MKRIVEMNPSLHRRAQSLAAEIQTREKVSKELALTRAWKDIVKQIYGINGDSDKYQINIYA